MRSYSLTIPLRGPHNGAAPLALPKAKKRKKNKAIAYKTRLLDLYARLKLYLCVTLLVLVAGCATLAPDISVGVRSAYADAQIRRVMLLPITAPAPFGMSPQEQGAMLALYEDQLRQRLQHMGFEVVAGEALRELIAARSLEGALELDGQPLADLFEDKHQESALSLQERTEALRLLARELGADAALFGQVIYHSGAECTPSDSSDYTPHVAFVQGPPTGSARVPCAISHFEAKMVDPASGRTLWYNRALRELRAPDAAASLPSTDQNARDTVDLVLTDAQAGLPPLTAQR